MNQMAHQMNPEQLAALQKQNIGHVSTAVVISFTILSLLCVVLRFYTRLSLLRKVGVEDYFIAVSMVSSLLLA